MKPIPTWEVKISSAGEEIPQVLLNQIGNYLIYKWLPIAHISR
jgi:hypothetical protein